MLLLVGNYSEGERALAHQIALAFGTEARSVTSDEELASISRLGGIRGVILDPSIAFAEETYELLSAVGGNMFTPVVETPTTLAESSILRGLSRGAVDVISRADIPALAERARRLCSARTVTRPALVGGAVVVAHENESTRLRLTRAFRTAGYNVREISNASSPYLAAGGDLIVVSQAIWFDAASARNAWNGTVILQPGFSGDDIPRFDGNMATINEASNPYDVVFAAGELQGRGRQKRSRSSTIVHSRMCTIREPGNKPQVASIYSLSTHALFISTLAAPVENSMLWVEFRLPDGDAVHLRGRVTFCCLIDDTPRRTPPGFELQLDELHCARPDLERYRATCETLVQEMDERSSGSCPAEIHETAVETVLQVASTSGQPGSLAMSGVKGFQSTYHFQFGHE